MSVATIGAVGLTDTDLIIPGVPQIPYALLLTGAGSTTEVIEVRSLQRGGHVYVTRGAFGSLPVAHTAPVVVTLYDPNSGGGGGGGGVTGEVPPAAAVSLTNLIIPGATISDGEADMSNVLGVQKVTVTLTNAQIKALPSTAVQLVAAPGVGKALAYLGGYFVLDFSVTYSASADASWVVMTPGGSVYLSAGLVRVQNRLQATGQMFGQFPGPVVLDVGGGTFEGTLVSRNQSAASSADLINSAIVIKDDYAGVSDYTGGDAANTLKVTTFYAVVDV